MFRTSEVVVKTGDFYFLLTGGLATVAIVAGVTAMAVGASEMSEGTSDYTKAQSGDMSKSFNFMRDTVCGGNETLYNIVKYGSVCISAGVSLFAFGGTAALGKAATDGGFRTAFNLVGDLLDDGSINRGLEYYTKDITLSMATSLFALKPTKMIGSSNLTCKQKFLGNSLVDAATDTIYQFGTGEDITPIKNIVTSLITNAIFSADPVNVATGSLFIPATDLVFSDINGEWKIDRQYNSVLNRTGVLGKGWTFSFESKLQRKEENTIHMLCTDGHVESFQLKDGLWENARENSLTYELKFNEMYNQWHCTNNVEKSTCIYNNKGQLIQIVDKNNNILTIDYEGESIKTLTTFSGHLLKFTYENSKIIQIEDALGRKIQYRYEGDYITHVCHVDHGITTYTYDDKGYIIAIKDQNGNTYTKNSFDDKGRVVYQEYPDGTGCKISYDEDNRESTFCFTDNERVERYRYNDKNLITHTFYEDGTYTEYQYDVWENRIVESDRNGNITCKTYNAYGSLEREETPQGLIITNTYDEEQNLIKKEDNAGGERLYSYDAKGNLLEEKVKIQVGTWQSTRYTYDLQGRIIKVTDPLGNAITYEYEMEGLMLPDAKVVKDAEGNIYSYEYDEVGRNSSITTDYGTAEFGYNTLNYVTLIRDGNGSITRKYYDKMGNLARVVTPNNYNASYDNGDAYEYRYDFFDQLIEIKDPLGNVSRKLRDSEGNIIKDINPNYYDHALKDGIGIKYVYDKDNRKIKTIYPDGGVERLFYDPNGNIIKRVAPEYYDDSNDEGIGYSYNYDSENRLTSIITSEGTVEKRYVYDLKGNIVEEIDAKGYSRHYKYNLIGQIVEKREPVEEDNEGILYNLTVFNYDEAGNKITERRARDFVGLKDYPNYYHEIHFSYDKNSRLIEVRDNSGATIQYKYDCLNNKTYECARINDNNYKRVYYKYDSAGNLVEKKEELNGKDISKENMGKALWASTKFTYDKNGNIIAIKTPKGYTIKRSYDKIDRIITEEQIDKESGISRKSSYIYDKIGNVLELIDTNNNSRNYTYDSKNRLTHFINENRDTTRLFYDKNDRIIKEVLPQQYDKEADDGQGTTITYDYLDRVVEVRNALGELTKKNTYDILGNIESTTDGANHKVDYTYNIAGKMKEIITPNSREKGKVAQKYVYDANGNITGISDGNGQETNYKLDNWGRITQIIHPGAEVEEYTYDYDLNGNRLQKVGNKHQSYYTYDSLNRLASAKYNTQSKSLEESFTYDKVGNRLTRKTNEGIEKYKYNVKNQLVEFNKNDEITKFNYDKQGNLTQEQHLEGITSYGYNSFNQTVKAVTKEGNTLVSRYDAKGLRYEIEENDRLTKFIFNKDSIIAELDEKDNVISRFSRGYEVVSSEINDKSYYYHTDEQGSTTHITNEVETIENSYLYDAFGVILESAEKVPNRITYTGQQYDPITQQYYLRARNYNPVIARFTQEDTYRGDGLGLYSYCSNNPVSYYDPSGYMGCSKNKKQASSVSGSTINRSSPASYYTHGELVELRKQMGFDGNYVNSHHLLEKQFGKKFGIMNTDDIIAVPLTPLWHKGVKSEKLLGIGNNLDNLISNELAKITGRQYKIAKQIASADQIWQAHRQVYERIGQKDWAEAVYEAYVKALGIKY